MSRPTITFTGIDENTSVAFLHEVAKKYATLSGHRAVEFAILRSPKAGQSPRYPDRKTVERITRDIAPHHLAFHLCGRYAQMVHDLKWAELFDVINFDKVGRVQVNSVMADEKAMITLQRFSAEIDKPVIMQWREDVIPFVHGVDLLCDRSGGRGIVQDSWPNPDELCRKSRGSIGYAGGLNPDNMQEQLTVITKMARGKPFWVDCETGVRTNDWFDQNKVRAMIDMVPVVSGRLAWAA